MDKQSKQILFLALCAFLVGVSSQEKNHDEFFKKISEERLNLCDEPEGEHTVTFYLFNLTNPVEYMDYKDENRFPWGLGNFQEFGPFVFREEVTREDCTIRTDDLNVEFVRTRTREFLPEASLPVDTQYNTLNMVYQRYAECVYGPCDAPFPSSALSAIWSKENNTRLGITVDASLFTGFNNSVFEKQLIDRYPYNLMTIRGPTFLPVNELQVPQKYLVKSDSTNYGQITSVEGKEFDAFPNCQDLTGTDGTRFTGGISKTSNLQFFSEDLSAVVPLVFQEEKSYQEIPALKFIFNPENTLGLANCDCAHVDFSVNNEKACLTDGLVDVKSKSGDMPFIMSLPHLLHANGELIKNVTGMTPNVERHQSYFVIEPVTGRVLESSVKFQVNAYTKRFPEDYDFQDDWEGDEIYTVFPYLWTEKKFVLAPSKLLEIRSYLEELQKTTTTPRAPGATDPPVTTAPVKDYEDKLNQILDQTNSLQWTITVYNTTMLLALAIMLVVTFSIFLGVGCLQRRAISNSRLVEQKA